MLALLLASVLPQQPAAPAYDPLALPVPAASAAAPARPPAATTLALTVRDEPRGRDVPLRVWLPDPTSPAPVVLWSHGLGGSRDNARYLGEHWSARGYVVVCLQHPGSDDSVWRGVPLRERMQAMRDAASARNFALRCDDVKAVLDQLERWRTEAGHALQGRLDLGHVGMSGHSFGAVTTQAVAGQAFGPLGARYTDARIDAALPMSPSPPRLGDPARAFGKVAVPWLLLTGTADTSPIGDTTAADRLAVFPALPAAIDRYELVLDGAAHGVFSAPGRDTAHRRAIVALSTAFWDAHLRGDAAARAWLHGDGAKTVLAPQDRWQVAATGAAGTSRR
jgi:predicted dienelactone hydrolase